MKKYSMNEESNPINIQSLNFRTDLAKKLEELVPEAIADGKVDVIKLKELLAEDAGEPNERFGLFWPGKKQALRAAQEPTTATLRPAKDESKDWDTTNNIFIEGDNLEVLKVLQKQYHNSIKMIYIDPPYNTGKDFVYPDNFKEGLQNYLEFSQQVDEGNKKISTNTETAGRYHSNWLNMMYPRLKLARNLLTDDGVIFISIDDAEQANLKKMCDEIFGEGNFIAQIIRNTNSSKNQSLFVSVSHEYCLVFARNIDSLSKKYNDNKWSVPKNNIDEYMRRVKKLQNEGLSGEEITNELKNLTNYPRFIDFTNYWYFDDRGLYRKDNIGGVKNGNMNPIHNPVTNKLDLVPPGGYRYSPEKIQQLISENRIHFHSDGSLPTIKRYLSENSNQRPKSIMSDDQRPDYSMLKSMGILFDNPKQMAFMLRILSIFEKDSTILDFFAGSGTTAHAVMQLNAEDGGNRKHIMVQLPEPTDEKSEAFKAGYKKISDIARERINRAGEKIKADFADKLAERETPLDVGYRTYKLADTNFTKWQSAPTGDLTELQARLDLMRESSNDNASEEDLLVEVLLKMGLPLTTRTQTVDVDGLHVYQVVAEGDSTEGQPVLYLNEHAKPTLEQLRAIITDLTPSKFVILDDAFQGDNQLKTNLVQTCKSYDVELWTV